eukprot:gene4147-4396_t
MSKGKQAQQQRELRAAVWDELQVRYTCPDALQEQKQNCLEGVSYAGLQCPVGDDVGLHYELALDLARLRLQKPPKAQLKTAEEAYTHALVQSLLVSSGKAVGFAQLAQQSTPASATAATAAAAPGVTQSKDAGSVSIGLVGINSPLVRLLQRVALWYYYQVAYSSPAQLAELQWRLQTELLFQLLMPHSQLAAMSDVLVMLACPGLASDPGKM